MTNLEKARKLVLGFKTGDHDLKDVLSDHYIEHDHRHTGERKQMEQFIADTQAKASQVGGKVRIVRSLVDGDFVVLHSVYINIFPGGDLVVFDVFRFEKGLIVEHWDGSQKRAPHNKSGRGMFEGPEVIEDTNKTQDNKKLVAEFFKKVLIEKTDQSSVGKYLHADYIQHNPNAVDTLAGTLAVFQAAAKSGNGLDFKRLVLLLGQGNFVFALAEAQSGGKPVAVFDLWRLKDGIIVEHWDVIEPVASKEGQKSPHPRF